MRTDNSDTDFYLPVRDSFLNESHKILSLIEDKDVFHEEKVHEIRKSLKRLKALLLLAKPVIHKKQVKHNYDILRESARYLTIYRETTANRTAYHDIFLTRDISVSHKHLQKIQKYLFNETQKKYEKKSRKLIRIFSNIKINILYILSQIEEVEHRFYTAEELFNQIITSYNDYKAIYVKADKKENAHLLHEWRKISKRLYYQIINGPFNAGKDETFIVSLDSLCDLLGNDHDLFVLQNFIKKRNILSRKKIKSISKEINQLRKSLQKDIFITAKEIKGQSSSLIKLLEPKED
ncbi:MAG: CHAD domain-containing protein [Bacteroidales bacterium]|nr:CHAD domain-containing protein [Bacteroidales bacterium]